MPSTHLSLTCHLVFSTKNREAWIAKGWRDEFHAYIGGVIRNIGAIPLEVGGVDDHLHAVFGFRAVWGVNHVPGLTCKPCGRARRPIRPTLARWLGAVGQMPHRCGQDSVIGAAAWGVLPARWPQPIDS